MQRCSGTAKEVGSLETICYRAQYTHTQARNTIFYMQCIHVVLPLRVLYVIRDLYVGYHLRIPGCVVSVCSNRDAKEVELQLMS